MKIYPTNEIVLYLNKFKVAYMLVCTYANNNFCKLRSLLLENIIAILCENCFGDGMMKHCWQSICLQAGQIHSPSQWH